MLVHTLKSWPEFFIPMWTGAKRFEIRRDDRHFKVGDTLRLLEWDPATEQFTTRSLDMRVTYITRFEQQSGFIVMGVAR